MIAALYVIGLIAMFVIGVRIGIHGSQDKPVGTLRIENSDPSDGPYLFLELATDPREIMEKKSVILDVNTKSYLSHD